MQFKKSVLVATGLSLLAGSAVAASGSNDLGFVANTVTNSMSNVSKLIGSLSYVGGVGFALAGIIKFKAHKDNPQQEPIGKAFVLIAVAAALIFLPSVIKSTGATLFGGSEKTGGSAGTGLDNIGGN